MSIFAALLFPRLILQLLDCHPRRLLAVSRTLGCMWLDLKWHIRYLVTVIWDVIWGEAPGAKQRLERQVSEGLIKNWTVMCMNYWSKTGQSGVWRTDQELDSQVCEGLIKTDLDSQMYEELVKKMDSPVYEGRIKNWAVRCTEDWSRTGVLGIWRTD